MGRLKDDTPAPHSTEHIPEAVLLENDMWCANSYIETRPTMHFYRDRFCSALFELFGLHLLRHYKNTYETAQAKRSG